MRVAGVVAAAGRSSRMGRCKALLLDEVGVPFVVRCARALREGGCAPIVVAVPDDEEDRARVVAAIRTIAGLVEGTDVVVARNGTPEAGLSGSILAAWDLVAVRADALVVAPVDAPFFDGALVARLIAAYQALPTGAALEVAPHAAVPVVVDGGGARRRGHPVLLDRAALSRLPTFARAGGPRALLDALGATLRELVVDDLRVVEDVDAPEDYARLVRGVE